ncbi:DUF72 domain-containing protein, partial [Fulvivirga sp. RKSG066]|uniref:DUF72 domain-containing protein n=1 Tax=Fulvivirga aurantia TaxID=2529383 RepID=UPI0012BC47A2
MKFGKLSEDELKNKKLSLPADHADTQHVLAKGYGGVKVHVGCAKWGRKEWVGLIYPKRTKDNDFLDEYVKHFNSIEMNTTFYSVKKANVESWTSRAPKGFMFCPKVSRNVTHIKRLNDDAKRYSDYFLEAISGFEGNLGPSFMQLPENFAGKYFERLKAYIEDVPEDFKLFVEIRHESWFEDQSIFDETFQLLKENNIGAVITDVADR